MSIASNRSRRTNAGSKMNEIANSNKEDDEFYKKTYGGFVEEENDNDFEPGSDEDAADESIGKNGDSTAELDDKEHPPAKRLKTEAKPYDEAECDDDDDDDEDAEDDEDDDEDDEDDDEEGDDDEDDDEEDAEENVDDDEEEVEGEDGDEDDEADEDADSSFENAKEKSKNAESEAIPESKAD